MSVKETRPFMRVLIDLIEISPEGEDGERYVLTFICVATRYPCYRAIRSRDSQDLGWILLDIVLDLGVAPVIIQSDNEFAAAAIEELVHLLGSRQIFSTVLHPQSDGIVE